MLRFAFRIYNQVRQACLNYLQPKLSSLGMLARAVLQPPVLQKQSTSSGLASVDYSMLACRQDITDSACASLPVCNHHMRHQTMTATCKRRPVDRATQANTARAHQSWGIACLGPQRVQGGRVAVSANLHKLTTSCCASPGGRTWNAKLPERSGEQVAPGNSSLSRQGMGLPVVSGCGSEYRSDRASKVWRTAARHCASCSMWCASSTQYRCRAGVRGWQYTCSSIAQACHDFANIYGDIYAST